MHFFITLRGDLRDLHADALSGHRRRQTRRYSQFTEVAYLQKLMPIHQFMTYAAIITIAAQFIFVINLVLEHVQGAEGERQSVGGDDSGVDDGDASAARQFWREDSGGESRAL
jgi:heme/copper-type cytochrome/quinol oxidase subunit 1